MKYWNLSSQHAHLSTHLHEMEFLNPAALNFAFISNRINATSVEEKIQIFPSLILTRIFHLILTIDSPGYLFSFETEIEEISTRSIKNRVYLESYISCLYIFHSYILEIRLENVERAKLKAQERS